MLAAQGFFTFWQEWGHAVSRRTPGGGGLAGRGPFTELNFEARLLLHCSCFTFTLLFNFYLTFALFFLYFGFCFHFALLLLGAVRDSSPWITATLSPQPDSGGGGGKADRHLCLQGPVHWRGGSW